MGRSWGPRWPQGGLKMRQDGPKRDPRGAQDGPKTPPRTTLSSLLRVSPPRTPQEAPGTPPRGPQTPPRTPPGGLPEASGTPQEASQTASQGLPRPFQMQSRCRYRCQCCSLCRRPFLHCNKLQKSLTRPPEASGMRYETRFYTGPSLVTWLHPPIDACKRRPRTRNTGRRSIAVRRLQLALGCGNTNHINQHTNP